HCAEVDCPDVWAVRAFNNRQMKMTSNQSWSAYTSATSAKRQNDSERQRNSAPPQAAHNRVQDGVSVRSSYNREKIKLTRSTAQRAENRLTRRAMLPIGKKVVSFASSAYVGDPAGWLIPRVWTTVTNSGESRQATVGVSPPIYKALTSTRSPQTLRRLSF